MKSLLIASIFFTSAMVSIQANAVGKSQLTSINKSNTAWSGNIGIILGEIESKSLDAPFDDNDIINSLDITASSYSQDIFTLNGKLSYSFKNAKTELFFASDEITGTPSDALEIGVSHELKNGSQLTAGYIKAWSYDMWQDPFLTGTKRKKIDADFEALHLSADYMFGSLFSFNTVYGDQTVDRDMAGNALSGSLSQTQINQLQRDYKIHHNQLTLLIPLSIKLFIEPKITHARVNAEGNANTHDKNALGIGFSYENGLWEFSTELLATEVHYDNINPIKDKKREDKSLDFSFMANYKTPFEWQDTSLSLIVSSFDNSSNIDYYDAQYEFIAVGLDFQF